ncbi:MAG: hypothetical protein U0229_05325 [Anaeromyxobacter sp.]
MGFFETLWSSPRSTPLSRYVGWNGLLYLAFGLQLYFWPGAAQVLTGAPPFQAGEAGLVRLAGFSLAVIGWFYVMGARTRADSFGLATVVDRLLVPFFLGPLAATGAVDVHLVGPFLVLDPVLGIGAWIVWRRSAAAVAAPAAAP